MWTSTRGDRGSGPCGRMWIGEGVKNLISCGRHKWMTPNSLGFFNSTGTDDKVPFFIETPWNHSITQNPNQTERFRALMSKRRKRSIAELQFSYRIVSKSSLSTSCSMDSLDCSCNVDNPLTSFRKVITRTVMNSERT